MFQFEVHGLAGGEGEAAFAEGFQVQVLIGMHDEFSRGSGWQGQGERACAERALAGKSDRAVRRLHRQHEVGQVGELWADLIAIEGRFQEADAGQAHHGDVDRGHAGMTPDHRRVGPFAAAVELLDAVVQQHRRHGAIDLAELLHHDVGLPAFRQAHHPHATGSVELSMPTFFGFVASSSTLRWMSPPGHSPSSTEMPRVISLK